MLRHVLALALIVALTHCAAAINSVATFYHGKVQDGTCSLPKNALPPGTFGAALSAQNWESGTMCGACVQVKGPKGSIKAMIIDKCPGCKPNQLDLYHNGFVVIGEERAGVIDIQWEVVPCGIPQPLSVRNMDGTSSYWFSMQVLNANQRVKALDVSSDGGANWRPTARRDFNYFVKPDGGGYGVDELSLRVTCWNGKEVRMNRVGSTPDATFSAAENC